MYYDISAVFPYMESKFKEVKESIKNIVNDPESMDNLVAINNYFPIQLFFYGNVRTMKYEKDYPSKEEIKTYPENKLFVPIRYMKEPDVFSGFCYYTPREIRGRRERYLILKDSILSYKILDSEVLYTSFEDFCNKIDRRYSKNGLEQLWEVYNKIDCMKNKIEPFYFPKSITKILEKIKTNDSEYFEKIEINGKDFILVNKDFVIVRIEKNIYSFPNFYILVDTTKGTPLFSDYFSDIIRCPVVALTL